MSNLGAAISAYREVNQYGIRALAKIIGVSHATLSRVERGENCDGKTLTKILFWLLIGAKKL